MQINLGIVIFGYVIPITIFALAIAWQEKRKKAETMLKKVVFMDGTYVIGKFTSGCWWHSSYFARHLLVTEVSHEHLSDLVGQEIEYPKLQAVKLVVNNYKKIG